MKLRLMAPPLLGALLALPTAGQAAVNVDRTRIIMGLEQKSVSIVLTNESADTPYLAQSWIEDHEGKMTNDLLALPPLQRIDSGKKAQVRIMQMSAAARARLPQDRETLFYFNVREIPPAPKDKNASILQLTTQSQLKLFLRPGKLAERGEAAPEQVLQIRTNGQALTLKNASPYYATVIWLGQTVKQRLPGFDAPIMLAPFSEQTLKAQLPASATELMLGNVDDYGGLRMNRYRCAAGECVFKERISE
ncbi:fimbria/pilus periplasmic chaperone [Achromobacter insuavis]|uniref:fimbria/pilus periplasmic chaperone n=2 Tax=Achromobacter insuavis TaxID=1287735 RepID=UPI0029D42FAA|nr:fimbria/pilus periplasmic chaperone [Achromobacter sp.]MCG2605749.1 fimbria/pilus periplasmic chaperone [Achromobacter sp.]